jgi:hypothetical protein
VREKTVSEYRVEAVEVIPTDKTLGAEVKGIDLSKHTGIAGAILTVIEAAS